MNKHATVLLVLPCLVQHAAAADARPGRGETPELLACLVVTLAALVLAYIGLRRGVAADERARSLHTRFAAEREARAQADQALADNHDVLCRLVRQHEGVRESERARIGRELQAELGRRLLNLRNDLSRMHGSLDGGPEDAPALAARLDAALANIDGALSAVRAVAGGLRGFGPGDGLRHALERCLAEHAHLYGLRYRFEAGVDPAARAGQDRSARLAVFRVLQDVLAGAAGRHAGERTAEHDGELHVRLLEGARTLVLEIDGCAGAQCDTAALTGELLDQVRAMGGVLRVVANAQRHARWSLSMPVHDHVAAPDDAPELARVA